jgi:DNA-binding PadR family transcriptional regulator
MTFYEYTAGCGPARGWWMNKERGGGHRRSEEFGRGPGGPPFGGPRGGMGGGPFGGPGGPGGPWGGAPFGGGRGRKRRGDVRIALLMLLAEEPRNGYGLMQTIEERSGGRWRPSPGSVYPALSQLEDEGFVRAVPQDGGRTFEITDAGRAHLAERGDAPAPWEAGDGAGANTFHELRSLVFGIGKAAFQVAQVGDEQQWSQAAEVLAEARRSLYRILAEEADSPEGETGADAEDSPGEPGE